MKRGLAYSLILHSIFIALLTIHIQGEGNGRTGGKPNSKSQKEAAAKELLPKGGRDEPREIEITLINIKKSKPKVKAPNAVEDCLFGMSYGGIGLMHSTLDMVTSVAKGYPADRAGIQIGDRLLNPDEVRGEVGTPVTVIVERGAQVLRFNVVREKICFK